ERPDRSRGGGAVALQRRRGGQSQVEIAILEETGQSRDCRRRFYRTDLPQCPCCGPANERIRIGQSLYQNSRGRRRSGSETFQNVDYGPAHANIFVAQPRCYGQDRPLQAFNERIPRRRGGKRERSRRQGAGRTVLVPGELACSLE